MTGDDWAEVARIFAEVLDLSEDARAACLAACPERLRTEVIQLVEAHRRAGPFLSADDAALESAQLAAGSVLGPWRIVGEIARGGMGTVYRATRDDGQFEKVVAIKVVAAGLLSQDTARRFRDERQILASLEHENIARLIDGGIDPLSRPYFVMEHVDGVPITEYCRGRALAERLALVRTTCAAVHHAHQRLIVHRDLKPGNVLVTREGVVKLLDFGIARPIRREATESWLQPMTPGYASPEQLRGEAVTTAADVWGLGALLYSVLAGRPPFDLRRATLAEAMEIVGHVDPPPPTRDADLNAIVAKAMRKAAAARYGSAAELSADLGRYQSGRPVDARRGSWRYAAGKFLQRHRTLAALLALFTVTAGVLAAVALRQATIAERERALAERRFTDVRRLVGTLIFDVHDRIAPLAGSTDTRRFLVDRGLSYLDALSEEAEGDLALERELAEGYLRLGDVQGRVGAANLGDRAGAFASYEKAAAIARRLLERAAPHAAADDVRRLATIERRIAEGLVMQRRRGGLERARRTVGWLEPLAAGEDEAIDLALAAGYFTLANAIQIIEDVPAFDEWQKALAVYDRLREQQPARLELLRNAALVHKYLGAAYQSFAPDDLGKAFEHYSAALSLDEQRVAADPDNAVARLDLTFDLTEIGNLLAQRGETAAAAARYRRAVEIRRALADADPVDVHARGRLVHAQVRLGRMLWRLGDLPDAERQYEEALAVADQVLAASPDAPAMPAIRADRADALAVLALLRKDCALHRRAVADIADLADRAPTWIHAWLSSVAAESRCR